MLIRQRILGLGIVFLLLCSAGLAYGSKSTPAEEIYYFNDGEKSNDLVFWTKAKDGKYTINSLGLSEEKAHSGKRSIKLDVTLDLEGHCYFKIPVNTPIKPDKQYFASGYLYVEEFFPEGRKKVGLGYNRIYYYGKEKIKNTSGCNLFDSVDTPAKDWVYMESRELGQEIVSLAFSVGLPTEKIVIDSIYVGIQGAYKNERVVLYIDDIKLSSTPQKSEKDVPFTDYPRVRKVFPYGLYGASTGGYREADASGIFKETFPEPLWRSIRDWKHHYINTIIGEGGYLFADSPPSGIEQLASVLDVFNKNNLYNIPNTYFTRYYKANLTNAFCEKVIREIIPRFKENNAVLAWLIIDEPEATDKVFEDYLWAKAIFEEIDQLHPAITGGSAYNYFFDKHRPVALFDFYALRENWYDPWTIANITTAIYKIARGPVWYIAPAFHDIGGEYIRPSREELRLISYSAIANGAKGLFFFLWRNRPYWTRVSNSGLVDPFEVSTELWDEVGNMGKYLTSIGPLLLSTEVMKSSLIEVDSREIEIAWEEVRHAIGVGILKDKDDDIYYLVMYNNDVKNKQEASISFDKKLLQRNGLYDLYSFENIQLYHKGGKASFNISFLPGEGRIYLLSSKKDFLEKKNLILATQFAKEKEIVKYDLYLAHLSGMATPEIISEYQKAGDVKSLESIRREINLAFADNKEFLQVEKRLSKIQHNLSEINTIFEEKVTSLESTVPYPSRYIKREFDGGDPVVKEYLDALLEIGNWYFTFQNLFLKGKYSEIGPDVIVLEEVVSDFHEKTKNLFMLKKSLVKLELPEDKKKLLRDRADIFKKQNPPSYPDPGSVNLWE